jgi:hypothetical protein
MDERKKILELVASGQLTIDEGDRILDALDAADRPQPEPATESIPGQRLYEAITRTIENSLGGGRAFRSGRRARGNVDQIVTFASHGVSPEYVREMLDLFDEDVSIDELTSLSNHDVSVRFAREMCDLFDELRPSGVIQLSSHAISPSFVEEMKELFDDIDVREIVRLSSHGVSPDYVRDLIDSGLEDLDVAKVIRRYDNG